MTYRYLLVAAGALTLVTACNRGEANNSAGNGFGTTTGGNFAAPVAPAAPTQGPGMGSTGGGAIDRAALVGHWGMDGDCSETISFNGDGTARATGEDEPVRWTVEGNTIVTTAGNDPPERLTVTRNGDTLSVNSQSGETMRLTRCTAPAAADEDEDGPEGETGGARPGPPGSY